MTYEMFHHFYHSFYSQHECNMHDVMMTMYYQRLLNQHCMRAITKRTTTLLLLVCKHYRS